MDPIQQVATTKDNVGYNHSMDMPECMWDYIDKYTPICLQQPPVNASQSLVPICGNGIIEGFEECDCLISDHICNQTCEVRPFHHDRCRKKEAEGIKKTGNDKSSHVLLITILLIAGTVIIVSVVAVVFISWQTKKTKNRKQRGTQVSAASEFF